MFGKRFFLYSCSIILVLYCLPVNGARGEVTEESYRKNFRGLSIDKQKTSINAAITEINKLMPMEIDESTKVIKILYTSHL